MAVDDGSTDGSGPQLDRFAAATPARQGAAPGQLRRPGRTQQPWPGPGRPAATSSSSAPTTTSARRRWNGWWPPPTDTAPTSCSARMVGVNGRYVSADVFAANAVDVSLFDSALPWSLSNTKLFRRELIERSRPALPRGHAGGQRPAVHAGRRCYHAKRITVLADYDYYYAVRRLDARNITSKTSHEERLRCTAQIMTVVADLVVAGPDRDAIMRRHFMFNCRGSSSRTCSALTARSRSG